MFKLRSISACLILVLVWASAARADDVSFMRDVATVLVTRCAGCHGVQKNRGDYRLVSFDDLTKPGASGAAPLVPGKPEESEIYRRVSSAKNEERMPPGDEPLPAGTVERFKTWIASGARFDGRDRGAPLRSMLPPRVHPMPPEIYQTAGPVLALAFAPDGKELAAGGYNEVTIWDPLTGRLLRRIKGLPQRIQSLAYNRSGDRLLVGGGIPGEYGEIALVDPIHAAPLRTFGVFEDLVLKAVFSHDETRVAAGSADRWARVFMTSSGALAWQTQSHSDWVTAVSFSRDDRFLATASKDKTIKVFDVKTGALFTTYNGHRQQFGPFSGRFDIYDMVFDAESSAAYSAGEGPVVRIWDPIKTRDEDGTAGDMEQRFVKAGHTRYLPVNSTKPVFKLSVHGGQVFSASGDRTVRQFDAKTAKLVREYRGHTDWVYAIDFSPVANRVASGAFDGEVRIWNATTGECTKAFKVAPGLNQAP